MKKGLLKTIVKFGTVSAAMTAVASATSTTGTSNATVAKTSANVSAFLNNSGTKGIIQAGAVLAALFGGYKVLLADGATGMHWFLLLMGGAFAGAYTTMTDIIISFF